jgi:hypothetical protein
MTMPICSLTHHGFACYYVLVIQGDLRNGDVPEDFSKLLLEKYRNYGDSDTHRNVFRYFATRILPAVNAGLTKFDRRKYKESLSECFSYTDEAFGILLVINYENRWQSQHAADMRLPGQTGKERSKYWDDARYTSATEGARRGASWSRDGLLKFNELSAMVKEQRDEDNMAGTGNMVEADLMGWCREEAGMPQLADAAGNDGSDLIHTEVDEEDEEVEATGECDIYQV